MKIILFLGNDRTTQSIEPALAMLKKYTLRPDCENMGLRCFDYDEFDAPFRGRAFCKVKEYFCGKRNSQVYVGTEPIYPEHPNAVSYTGAFLEISWAFSLATDEPELIATLDQAIAENMQTNKYKAAMAEYRKRYGYQFLDHVHESDKPATNWAGFPQTSLTPALNRS